jgi:hypothetical protein
MAAAVGWLQHGSQAVTSRHSGPGCLHRRLGGLLGLRQLTAAPQAMGLDLHLIANFAALALITLAGPAVIFILFYRRGAL